MTYQSSGIMDLLKEATAEQHRNAERRRLQKEMVSGRLPVDTYRNWLGQMLLLHSALWSGIVARRVSSPALAEIVDDNGRHAANLRADLIALDGDPDEIDPLPATERGLSAIRSTADEDPLSLLGYNYVLEGSMNGNRFIARVLTPALKMPATTYLDPYGEEQRPVWGAYRERMNAAGFDASQAERMVAAARDMFSTIAELSDQLIAEPAEA
jgi:heme oxygenase